jgi:hypothetical protein
MPLASSPAYCSPATHPQSTSPRLFIVHGLSGLAGGSSPQCRLPSPPRPRCGIPAARPAPISVVRLFTSSRSRAPVLASCCGRAAGRRRPCRRLESRPLPRRYSRSRQQRPPAANRVLATSPRVPTSADCSPRCGSSPLRGLIVPASSRDNRRCSATPTTTEETTPLPAVPSPSLLTDPRVKMNRRAARVTPKIRVQISVMPRAARRPRPHARQELRAKVFA